MNELALYVCLARLSLHVCFAHLIFHVCLTHLTLYICFSFSHSQSLKRIGHINWGGEDSEGSSSIRPTTLLLLTAHVLVVHALIWIRPSISFKQKKWTPLTLKSRIPNMGSRNYYNYSILYCSTVQLTTGCPESNLDKNETSNAVPGLFLKSCRKRQTSKATCGAGGWNFQHSI